MKAPASLLACIMLLTTPAVAAEDPFCDQINKVIIGASDGFSALRGEAQKGEIESWVAKEAIRGGKECFILGKTSPSYMCSLYAGDDDEAARLTYKDHVEWVGKCLGDEWNGQETADAGRSRHTFSRGSGNPTIRILSQTGRTNAYTVEIWVDPPET